MSRNHTPGKWLYNPAIVSWLDEPAASERLPWPYRFLALYCRSGKFLGNGDHIPGMETLFTAIARLSATLHLPEYVRLDLEGKSVYLNLSDPRMLNVPNEIRGEFPRNILSSSLAEGDTFVDVGANHGSFSIVASESVGSSGKIVAIEPQVSLAHLIERSLKANARCDFRVYALACGDRDGVVALYVPEGSSGEASIFPSFAAVSKHRALSVPVRRFDDAIPWRDFTGKTFVKLDVEGSELSFLKGANEMIRALEPTLLLEINPSSLEAANVKGELLVKELRDLGYAEFADAGNPRERKPSSEIDTDRFQNILLVPATQAPPGNSPS